MKNTMLARILSFIVFACAIAGTYAENPVRLDNAGRLVIGDISFAADFWDGKRNFTQGRDKEWLVTDRKNDDSGQWRREGLLSLPQDAPAPFASQLKQSAPGVFTYDITVEKTTQDFTFRTSLPGDVFVGRVFRLDDQELALPLEKDRVEVFSGKAGKIVAIGRV